MLKKDRVNGKKVFEVLEDYDGFCVIVGKGFNINVEIKQAKKQYKGKFRDILELEVENLSVQKNGIIIYVK